MKRLGIAFALAIGIAGTAASSQSPFSGGGKSSLGGMSGLLGGGLPNIGAASAGNAAGVLGYCVKNNVLSGAGAASVLGNLTGKKGIASSPDFSAGQSGQLRTGDSTLSLDSLKGQVKTKVCDLVLQHAKSLI